MPDLTKRNDRLSFVAGDGEMARRIRSLDWSQHPFGPPEQWPQSLRSAVSICLHSAFPTAIYWGPELRLLYNDAWAPIPGPRHPAALGKPGKEVWSDIWEIIWPQFRHLLETGEGFYAENQLLPMRRYGFEEETYWNYSFTAIRGEDGRIAGIFNSGFETTEVVLAQRRLEFMLDFSEKLHDKDRAEEAVESATALLAAHFGAVHVGYCEAETGEAEPCLLHDWAAPGAPPAPADLCIEDFGEAIAEKLSKGKVVRIDDVESFCAGSDASAPHIFTQLHARSALFAPWMHSGRLRALLYVLAREPRRWSDSEVATLQEALETARDTISLLHNEERQELLMRELDHRAKNALAVVQAVVHLSQADNIDDFRKVVEGRIAALARAHDLLAESRWKGVELRSLIEEELRAFGDVSSGRLNISGPNLRLPPELAQSVALAVHELATNAAKYGALKGSDGTLNVDWQNAAGSKLVLDWHETAAEPISPPAQKTGFGSELLNKSIRNQLGGEITFDWDPAGLKCRLVLPLEIGAARGGARSYTPPAATPPPDAAPRSGPPRLLLAEDEPLVAMDLEARLESLGYRVVATVDSVADALQALDNEQPDLALLDANLHGESSVPAALELHRRGVQVVFVTGYDKIDGLPEELAGLPKLSKPILDDVLRKTLAGLLAVAAAAD
jgi:two-component sensor histidine kinase